ncbi:MAG: glutamate synthase subunit beta [Spirochaetaceae bacterium]|jgi:glutamate synthase (NADPH/NADH) small chain|nr:glutamate synthase subunit beta [Spirochaetaceae bacterium]
MGDPKGFLKVKRKVSGYRPLEERINDYSEVEQQLGEKERRDQASRCMDCGVPFCHWACPVGNVMPEWQDRLYRGDWAGAWTILQNTTPFPEFTGRVCPALCEASCVLGVNDEPVTCRQNELAVIEKAFELNLVRPRPPQKRNNKKIAVIGAGPAGLSAAYYLNQQGFNVTVFEADAKAGGYLRYGIPNFKLDKSFIDRRIALMEAEGIVFCTGVSAGNGRFAFGARNADKIISARELESSFDLVLLTIGAREPRDLNIPGRELNGIVQALDFLSIQNRNLAGETRKMEHPERKNATAYGKKVLVIGGGDTGSDCVGTANRQGAIKVTQIEVMPKPPEHRPLSQPWPLWPMVFKTTSSHQEGCERLWSVNTRRFMGEDCNVKKVTVCCVEWVQENDRPVMKELLGSDFEVEADLVLLAMGFVHVVQDGIVADLGLETDVRGNIRTQGSFHTSNPKVWAAGDSRNGASLVVRAIADGKAAAEAIGRNFCTI